jgi:hypothetical protein
MRRDAGCSGIASTSAVARYVCVTNRRSAMLCAAPGTEGRGFFGAREVFGNEGWPDRDDRHRLVVGTDRVRVACRRNCRPGRYATERTDGFFQTGEVRLASATYAITSDRVDLESEPGGSDRLIDRGALGTVRLSIDPGRRDTPIFAGIGPTTEVTEYLEGVSHDAIRDFELSPDRMLYRRLPGEATPSPPADQPFLVAEVTTDQAGELTWEVESGDWSVVLMNVDASRGVDLDARLGINVDWLLPVLIGLMIAGVILLAGGATLVIVGSRGLARRPEPAPARHRPTGPLAQHRQPRCPGSRPGRHPDRTRCD